VSDDNKENGLGEVRSHLKKAARAATVVAAVTLALSLAACSSSGRKQTSPPAQTTTTAGGPALAQLEKAPATPVSLLESGSTLMYPLMNLWIPGIKQDYPNVSITPASTGSGTGVAQAAAGVVQMGASDNYLSLAQRQQNPNLENIAVAVSAQVIVYNLPGLGDGLKLSGKVLSDIYRGKVTKWNDAEIASLNPGKSLPDLPVTPLHRADGSGDTFLFTYYLSQQDPNGWGGSVGYGQTVTFPAIQNAVGEQGNAGMVSKCASTPGCVAYVGISYLKQVRSGGMGVASLLNGSGRYVAPDASSIQAEVTGFAAKVPSDESVALINGPGYPIVNFEYVVVSTKQANPEVAQALKAVLAWMIDPAKGNSSTYLSQVNFQPLPAAVRAMSLELINKISAG
jgi:phosphate transport system substrate-binding protein